MSTKRVSAYATVQITVEVSGVGTWGPECSVDQVHRQATEEAIDKLRRVCQDSRDIRIVGTPAVKCVTTEEQR